MSRIVIQKQGSVFCGDCKHCRADIEGYGNDICQVSFKTRKHPVYGELRDYTDCCIVNKDCNCKLFKKKSFWRIF